MDEGGDSIPEALSAPVSRSNSKRSILKGSVASSSFNDKSTARLSSARLQAQQQQAQEHQQQQGAVAGADVRAKRSVSWIDFSGRELQEVKEFTPSEPGTSEADYYAAWRDPRAEPGLCCTIQ